MTDEEMKAAVARTIAYYDEHAEDYTIDTQHVDFSDIHERFTKYLPNAARILDLGCGAGRDIMAFRTHGYRVDAVDGSAAMCRVAAKYSGITVTQARFDELDARDVYDGIWACASICHLPEPLLRQVLLRMAVALKSGGVIYASFRHGQFSGTIEDGRFFTDFTETIGSSLMAQIPVLETVDVWRSFDARPDKRRNVWLNVLLRKTI
jgi:SAM-dependent methyltransferase